MCQARKKSHVKSVFDVGIAESLFCQEAVGICGFIRQRAFTASVVNRHRHVNRGSNFTAA